MVGQTTGRRRHARSSSREVRATRADPGCPGTSRGEPYNLAHIDQVVGDGLGAGPRSLAGVDPAPDVDLLDVGDGHLSGDDGPELLLECKDLPVVAVRVAGVMPVRSRT
jgi:hypothetical protein